MDEEWRPVAEFAGYDVSSWGRFRSHKSGRPKFRRQSHAAEGQGMMITFCEKGRNYTRLAHLVVAETFLGERPDGHRLTHLDGDRINNEVSNLSYEAR